MMLLSLRITRQFLGNCNNALFCIRHKTSVQSRGTGIFGSLGLGDLQDELDYCTIPSSCFSKCGKDYSNVPKRNSVSKITEEAVYPVSVEAGLGHSVVLTNDGKLYVFGRAFDLRSVMRIYSIYKYSGIFARFATKLTIESDHDNKVEVLMSPYLLPGIDRYKFTKVSCSGGLTAALTDSGQVFCFGVNGFGQCGTGAVNDRYWKPTVNVGVPKVQDIDVGLQHTLCLCVGGDVYAWGKGKNGQIGNDSEKEKNAHPTKVMLPVQAISIGAGLNHSAAVGKDGLVYIWGRRMGEELIEGTNATYQDQLLPRSIALPNDLKAEEIYCSSFSTVVRAIDNSLWIIGVDEIYQDIHFEFKPVYAPLTFREEGYTVEELDSLVKEQFFAEGCIIKKGYHSVSVISACQRKVYDITLQRGISRLFEVILDPREDGKVLDYSAGFRHSLLLTSSHD